MATDLAGLVAKAKEADDALQAYEKARRAALDRLYELGTAAESAPIRPSLTRAVRDEAGDLATWIDEGAGEVSEAWMGACDTLHRLVLLAVETTLAEVRIAA